MAEPSEWAMKQSYKLAPSHHGAYGEEERVEAALNIAAALDAARAAGRKEVMQNVLDALADERETK